MTNVAPPQYASQPVILMHLGMDNDPSRTLCAGVPYLRPRVGAAAVYPSVPTVPCPLCLHLAQKEPRS